VRHFAFSLQARRRVEKDLLTRRTLCRTVSNESLMDTAGQFAPAQDQQNLSDACLEENGERRIRARYEVMIRAAIRQSSRPWEGAVLINLSTGGCALAMPIQFPEGARVWLKLPDLESWLSEVVWSQEGRCGLRFARPLHDAVVQRYVSLSSRRPASPTERE
jgi:hypothetical protein